MPPPLDTGPRIIAIGGGKGGAGRSLLAANIGIFLATLGKRVTLVDAAFGAANLHQFVGVVRPPRSLADMLGNAGLPVEGAAVETPVPGLSLVAGEGDPAWASNPKAAQINKLVARLQTADADYLVVDLAGGTAGVALDLYLLAHVGIVVATPEPPSIELAYRFLRAAFVRRLRKVGIGGAAEIPAEELRMYEGGIPAPSDVAARAAELDPALAERVVAEQHRFRPRFVVNMVRSKAEMALCADLARAVQRRFGVPAEALGHLEWDDAVAVAVRRRRPLLIEHPESRIARCLERVTRKLLSRDAPEPVSHGPDTFYDLLEIDPAATEEEIRRAHRRVREVYGRESLVAVALYNKARLDDLHVRIDEAYETLMDPARRKAYDQALFPGGVPVAARHEESDPSLAALERDSARLPTPIAPPAEPPPPRPPRPELPPDANITGALMRELREAAGLSLREISDTTKIGMGYLTALEEEDFLKLPAVVYVRGFLVQYSRMLRIDEQRVLATYLERYRAHRAGAEEQS